MDIDEEWLGGTQGIYDVSALVDHAHGNGPERGGIGGDFSGGPGALTHLRKARRHVIVNRLAGGGAQHQAALIQHDGFFGQAQDGRHVVADKEHRAAFLGHIAHLAQALALEFGVPNGQDFIDHQDFGLQVGCHGKSQPQIHPAGIVFDRGIDELLYFGKGDHLIEFALDLTLFHPQDRPVEISVLTPGQLGVEAGADLQQRADPAVYFGIAFGGFGDAGEDFEQRAFAGPIPPDNAQHLAFGNIEGNVFQRPNGGGFLTLFSGFLRQPARASNLANLIS